MENHEFDSSCLFTSEELATHIVDTLVDHGLIDKARFKVAVASVKWELDGQHGIGRIMLNAEVKGEKRGQE
jgi:CYTH domain-containing protein